MNYLEKYNKLRKLGRIRFSLLEGVLFAFVMKIVLGVFHIITNRGSGFEFKISDVFSRGFIIDLFFYFIGFSLIAYFILWPGYKNLYKEKIKEDKV